MNTVQSMSNYKKGMQQNKNVNAKISNAQELSAKNLWKEGLESLNKKDYKTAFFKFAAAANKDYSNAQLELGNLLFEGKGCTKNTSSAFYWYENAAKAGNSLALKRLKELSENGISQAKAIFEKYAKKQNAVTQNQPSIAKAKDRLEDVNFWERLSATKQAQLLNTIIALPDLKSSDIKKSFVSHFQLGYENEQKHIYKNACF